MDFYGSHFEYSGTSSREYGLIIVGCKSDRYIKLSGEIESENMFSKNSRKNYFIGESFENSPLHFDAEVITDNDMPLSDTACKEIQKWLFRKPGYRKLYLDEADDTNKESFEMVNGVKKKLYLNCRFVNPRKLEYNGGTVGYGFTIECDSAMLWQDPVKYEFTSKNFTINVDSDIKGYVYPRVTIQVGSSGGDIKITNNTDSDTRITSFVGLTSNISLIVDGNDLNYVSGDNYQKFSNRNFVRLLDGENSISIVGDVKNISFEFQNRRYL